MKLEKALCTQLFTLSDVCNLTFRYLEFRINYFKKLKSFFTADVILLKRGESITKKAKNCPI